MFFSHHSPHGMPHVPEDPALQRRLANFVTSNGGLRPAARKLGLEHSMVNRLMKGGRVIERNRTAANSALDRQESATATATTTETATASAQVGQAILPNDLTSLRSLCMSVLALIDNYNSTGGELAALSSKEAKSA